MEQKVLPERGISRRQFVKASIGAGLGIGIARRQPNTFANDDSTPVPSADTKHRDAYWNMHTPVASPEASPVASPEATPEPIFNEDLIPSFRELPDRPEVGPNTEGYDTDRLEYELLETIDAAEQSGEPRTFTLPEGEITITRPLSFTIPEGIKILIVGKGKSHLVMDESIADFPPEWGSQGHNMLKFDMHPEAMIMMHGVHIDGGYHNPDRDAKNIPDAGWNHTLLFNQIGSGGGFEPAPMDAEDMRSAKVHIGGCHFYNGKAGGMHFKNLGEVVVKNCTGKDLDALVTSSWSKNLNVAESTAQQCFSEGFGFYASDNVQVTDIQVDGARKGVIVDGCTNVQIDNALVQNAMGGYHISRAEVNQRPSQNIHFSRNHSRNVGQPILASHLNGALIEQSYHDEVGNVAMSDPVITDMERPEDFGPDPINIWKPSETKNLLFDDVQFRLSQTPTRSYNPPKYYEGVTYFGFDK